MQSIATRGVDSLALGLAVALGIITNIILAFLFVNQYAQGQTDPWAFRFRDIPIVVAISVFVGDSITGLLYAFFHMLRQDIRVSEGAAGGLIASSLVRISTGVPGFALTCYGFINGLIEWQPGKSPNTWLALLYPGGVVELCLLPVAIFLAAIGGAIGAAIFGTIRNLGSRT